MDFMDLKLKMDESFPASLIRMLPPDEQTKVRVDIVGYLNRVISLIEKPGNWTTRSYARNAAGIPTVVHDDDACSFCSTGAMRRAIGPAGDRLVSGNPDPIEFQWVEAAITIVAKDDGFSHITGWNDSLSTDHTRVINAFRTALGAAEASL